MDNHKRNNHLGVENHGSHLCHKCGWNFPNPHPSAKHRRAHKRVCGKIDGFSNVIDELEEHSQLSVGSDGDPLTPSPKPKNGSRDEAFVDSAKQFSENGLKPEQLHFQVEDSALVVENAIKEQLMVDIDKDCIEKPNIEQDGCLKHNLDVLETPENHIVMTVASVSEEMKSVPASSLEKTCVEIVSLNILPSYSEEGDKRVEHMGSMEVRDFSTEVNDEEEDNSPVGDAVQVFYTKEARDELSARNNSEVVSLEENAEGCETIELEKAGSNVGLTVADDKMEIIFLHGSSGNAEVLSLEENAEGCETIELEKAGSNVGHTVADDKMEIIFLHGSSGNAEVVSLEENAEGCETIELEKAGSNMGHTVADDKMEIIFPHGSSGNAEFSSTVDGDDGAIDISTVSNIEKEGSRIHNLDETPTIELRNATTSEEIVFVDISSNNKHLPEHLPIKVSPKRGENKEEIISSKVSNWSMAKQHTPLKSLLLSENELISSSPDKKPLQQTEEGNSSLMKSESETYPKTSDETKNEKRKVKVKGRPNWIQCVCCSSVH